MKFKALTPMLRTWDLQATIAFYTDVLGFRCHAFSGDWGWASLKREQVVRIIEPDRDIQTLHGETPRKIDIR
jgi:catechol 2,3-dioxygenase-like lactoylglutathione lyase family enzyme